MILMTMKDCTEHNHIMNYTNKIKINDDVKNVLKQKISKGYTSVAVNKNVQGVKWKTN